MTPKPKTPTQRGISLLLNKAGFERSRSIASRVRGYKNHSEGYVVTGQSDGVVSVTHVTFSHTPLPNEVPHIAAMHERYAAAIEAAGFVVENRNRFLIVTAKED